MRPPPDVFAAVMATGIISIAGAAHGYHWISLVLAVIAGCALPVLVVVCAYSWWRPPLDFRDPDVLLRLFTYVAACAVLGRGWPSTGLCCGCLPVWHCSSG